MERFNDDELVLSQKTAEREPNRVLDVVTLERKRCSYCPNGLGLVMVEEKQENGQTSVRTETCPVCKGGRSSASRSA